MQCPVCGYIGQSVMRKCKKCGKIWCSRCAPKGKAPYPLQKAANQCPYCKALDSSESA